MDAFSRTVSNVVDVTDCNMFPLPTSRPSVAILHGSAVEERGFSDNTAILRKERMSLDETTVIKEAHSR